jgi:hypothetical protein
MGKIEMRFFIVMLCVVVAAAIIVGIMLDILH